MHTIEQVIADIPANYPVTESGTAVAVLLHKELNGPEMELEGVFVIAGGDRSPESYAAIADAMIEKGAFNPRISVSYVVWDETFTEAQQRVQTLQMLTTCTTVRNAWWCVDQKLISLKDPSKTRDLPPPSELLKEHYTESREWRFDLSHAFPPREATEQMEEAAKNLDQRLSEMPEDEVIAEARDFFYEVKKAHDESVDEAEKEVLRYRFDCFAGTYLKHALGLAKFFMEEAFNSGPMNAIGWSRQASKGVKHNSEFVYMVASAGFHNEHEEAYSKCMDLAPGVEILLSMPTRDIVQPKYNEESTNG